MDIRVRSRRTCRSRSSSSKKPFHNVEAFLCRSKRTVGTDEKTPNDEAEETRRLVLISIPHPGGCWLCGGR